MTSIVQQAERARRATRTLRALGRAEKDRALLAIADKLRKSAGAIAEHNARDLEAGQGAGAEGLSGGQGLPHKMPRNPHES